MKAKNLYVAATNQHVGKTTSTLGLASAFKRKGVNVGYCKPVGQHFLDLENIRVDKDTLLFADLLGFELAPEIHSPVILGSGATSAYLDDPFSFQYESAIRFAIEKLESLHDFIIYEGTGHPGVGSIVNLSNADVASMLQASVIMVVEGGIGSTFDRLNLSMALFRERKVPILGVIVNKVLPEKRDKVEYYMGKKLDEIGIPLLGLMPYDEVLAHPIISTIVQAIDGVVVQNIDQTERKVEHIMAGSLLDANRLKISKNILLVVGADRVNNAIHKIDLLTKVNSIEESPLVGILAAGEGKINDASIEYLDQHKIPLIRTNLDTYGSVLKISRIEVKINLSTPWKIKKAIDLIEANIDLEKILSATK